MYERPSHRKCFRVDVGRTQHTDTGGFCSFVRVSHLPTGLSRTVAGLGDRSATDVADELAVELLREIEQAEGMGFEPT